MLKRTLIAVAVLAGTFALAAPQADAGIYYRRVAPVRRAVLPPYRVARRVVWHKHRYVRPVVAAPVYSAPVVYGPGVYVGVGF